MNMQGVEEEAGDGGIDARGGEIKDEQRRDGSHGVAKRDAALINPSLKASHLWFIKRVRSETEGVKG